jgi:hypothetical protein
LTLTAQGCQDFCPAGVTDCSVVVQGQTAMTIDCNGMLEAAPQSVANVEVLAADCSQICDTSSAGCTISNVDLSGTVPVNRNMRNCYTSYSCATFGYPTGTGRRPADLLLPPCQAHGAVGSLFAAAAQLEAASVAAFAILAAELRAHGAPASLVAAAERAQRDEERHTRMTTALARRYASRVVKPTVSRGAVRPLLAIALENAVEGCVREAYGAFTASWQGAAAGDPIVRTVMARIARDELRHAELAFAVAAWLGPQLSEQERAQVCSARARAVSDLLDELAQPQPAALHSIAGLPPAAISQSFVRGLPAPSC